MHRPGNCHGWNGPKARSEPLANDPQNDQISSFQSNDQDAARIAAETARAQYADTLSSGNSYDTVRLADAARAIIGNVYHFHEAPKYFGHTYENQLQGQGYQQHNDSRNLNSSSDFDDHFPAFSSQGLPSYLQDAEVAPGSRFARSRTPVHRPDHFSGPPIRANGIKSRDVISILGRLRTCYNLEHVPPHDVSRDAPPQLHDSQVAMRINHWLNTGDPSMLYVEYSFSCLTTNMIEPAGLDVARICSNLEIPVAVYFSSKSQPEPGNISLEQLALDIIETIVNTMDPEMYQTDPIWKLLASAEQNVNSITEQDWSQALDAALQSASPTLHLIIDLTRLQPSTPARWIIQNLHKFLNDSTNQGRKCLVLGSSSMVDLRAEFQPKESVLISLLSPTKLPLIAPQKSSTSG